MESLKIEKYVNPNIKVGDKIKMYDGSSFTDYETGERWYIGFPLHVDSLKDIKDIVGEVIETGCEYIIPSRIDDSCYLQDIVVEIGGKRFRTASGMVTKIETMSFKKFLEDNNINWDDFLENCRVENQRWILVDDYYDYPEEKLQEKPIAFIINAFNWRFSKFWPSGILIELNNKWQDFVKNYNGKITFK